jgi:4-amino-4-deoxy-L-arabinose transferase-like glycosyltransferase
VRSFPGRTFFSGWWGKVLAVGIPAAAYLGFLLSTLPSVPFHPDEATYIYMSRDLDRILQSGPLTVCWRPGGESDPLQRERERDCPLTRYSIGLARIAGGLPATDSNWNWSQDWQQNLALGAVPSSELLYLSRLPEVFLLFLSVLLMARIGLRLGGGVGAVSAALIFGLNSQILLHGRRAMSESGLLFGMILVVAVLLEERKNAGPLFRDVGRPLLTGAALAVAVSAKYSGLLMAPVAVVGLFWIDPESSRGRTLRNGLIRTGVMILAFLGIFLVLNPVYWCDPLGTLAAVVAERQRLMGDQMQALHSAAPMSVLDSLPKRLMALLYEWLIAQLAFWEIPNYSAITAASEKAYLARPLHALTLGQIGSFVSAVLAFFGLGWAAVRSLRRDSDTARLLAPIWFTCVFLGIIAGVPILWQRYYLPLLPAGAALSAGAVGAIIKKSRKELDRFYKIKQD